LKTESLIGIPEKHWWCGCGDGIDFDSEYEFVKHMQSKKHNWTEKEFSELV